MKDVKNIDELDKWFAYGDDWRSIVAKQEALAGLNDAYKKKYEDLL